jgi:primary-amine oxidase
MKRRLLPSLGLSVICTVTALAADAPGQARIHVVGKQGLRIDGQIAKTDPRVRFKLKHEGKGFELGMHCKMFEVQLSPRKRYTITLNAAQKGLDPYLVVHDDQGRLLGFDDDSGGHLNSRLVLEVSREGRYKVYAASLNNVAGKFTLTIAESQVNIVRQGFPAAKGDPMDITRSDTAWEIEWDITNTSEKGRSSSMVLAIRSARFMFKDTSGKVHWFTVVKNLQVSEILVPYDRLDPVFLDVSDFTFNLIPARKEFLGPNCVLPGEILDASDPQKKNKVLKEVHDDGLRWANQYGKVRRGEQMLLWSLFDGGNYRYILEYGFKDDGSISCRVGATAHNFFDRRKDQGDVHLHVGCWRLDPELSEDGPMPVGGDHQNQALLVRRVPRDPVPNGMFRVDVAPFNANGQGKAMEGFADWKAEEFTILRLQSLTRKNSSKDPHFTAYDLIPIRTGSVRNYPWKYAFANHDFWVTHRQPPGARYRDVPLHATFSRPLDKAPLTVWHNSPSLHVPRGEDFGPDGVSRNYGAAITSWTGFLLRPVNLFDSTPLYSTK